MTTIKKPKKQKLRNAEYYDLQATFDKLYLESKNGKTFTKIMPIILSENNIRLAYRNLKRNSGSKTAGTDNKTIKDLETWKEPDLVRYVRKRLEWYIPQPVRRVEIAKDNGKTRPLGIPTIQDRLIQQCFLQVLEPICEAKFHDRSFGFRPNRSQENAVAVAYSLMQIQHLHFVVDLDIKGFFDNVSHGKLLRQMWALGIRDKTVLSILSAMLKAEVAGIGFRKKERPRAGSFPHCCPTLCSTSWIGGYPANGKPCRCAKTMCAPARIMAWRKRPTRTKSCGKNLGSRSAMAYDMPMTSVFLPQAAGR